MNKLSIDDVLDEIAKNYYHRNIKPEDITVRRFCAREGVPIKKGRLALEAAVTDGILTKELVYDNETGKIVSAYTPTGKKIHKNGSRRK